MQWNKRQDVSNHMRKHDILIVAVLVSKFKVIEMVACNLVKQLNKLISYEILSLMTRREQKEFTFQHRE